MIPHSLRYTKMLLTSCIDFGYMDAMKKLVKLSKFLSYMLRHKPDRYGLVMDEEGFTDLEAVWTQVEKRFGSRY